MLSAIPNSNELDFWYADVGSGRQQWFIPNFKNEQVASPGYDKKYKDQAINNLHQALSLIDISKVETKFKGAELGNDFVFNALPFTFWVDSGEGKSESWGSSLLSIKTHFGFYVQPDTLLQGAELS
jgi:hypothetical protein